MAEEHNHIADLLNQYVPPNPGKPRPMPPPEPEKPEVTAEETDTPAGPHRSLDGGARSVEVEAAKERMAEEPAPRTPASAEPWDFDTLAEGFERVAADLQRQATELTAALDEASQQSYEVAAADGAIKVIVDGQPRVTSVYVGAKAVRSGPEALAATVLQAVNQALQAARTGAQGALLDRLDPALRVAVTGGTQEGAEAVKRSEADS